MQIARLELIDDSELDTLATIFRENPNAEIVKYSPHKRCLLRIEKAGKEYFVKVYPKKFAKRERGEKIHVAGHRLWELAAQKKTNFIVPKPVGWCGRTRSIWQEKLAGVNIPASCGGDGFAYEIGRGVALLSRLEIDPPRFFDRREQNRDSQEFGERIRRSVPSLRMGLDRFGALAGRVALPPEKLVPVHGDMHPDQWLCDGERLALVDFEDFSLGEIERDLASFIVQVRAEYPETPESFTDSFMAGFRSAGLSEDARLMKFYAAHKWLAKAAKDETRAAERLNTALGLLESL